MGNGQSLGCHIIDSGRQPDRNNPFTRNTQMFDDIKTFKCTEYRRDPVTNRITDSGWTTPLSITDTDENINSISNKLVNKNNSGSLIPQNICFENDQFFGLGGVKSHQSSYTKEFCNNITPVSNIDFFKFPQDSNFRELYLGIDVNDETTNNKPEWTTPIEALYNQLAYNINRNAQIGTGILNQAIGLGIKRGVAAAKKAALKSIFKKKKAKASDDDAEDEGDGAEATEETDVDPLFDPAETTFENPAFEFGEEALDATDAADAAASQAAVEAATEAAVEAAAEGSAAASAASVAGATSSAFLSASGPLIVIGIAALIASGFSQDLADSTCGYDDMHKPTLVYIDQKGHPKAACCRDSCSVAGIMTACSRNSGFGFNASFFQCCLQDYDCYKNKTSNNINFTVTGDEIKSGNKKDLCFQAETQKNQLPKIATCHPDARSLNSPLCSAVVGAYCTGQTQFGENQTTLLDAWSSTSTIDFKNENGISFSVKSPCLNLMARLLTGNTSFGTQICSWDDFVNANLSLTPELLDPVGLTIAEDILDSILNEYLETYGSPIGKINENGYLQSSDFINWFFNLCGSYPFLCQTSLTNFCSSLTPDQLLEKPETVRWCGCYLEDEYYEKYNRFGIPKQCSPLCNRKNNIPLLGDDGVPINCTDTICMIDDLSIKLAQTFTQGPINFNQVCNTCGGSDIVKKYSSFYQANQNTDITEFFEIVPLSTGDYNLNGINNSINKNISLIGYQSLISPETYKITQGTKYNIVKVDNTLVFDAEFDLGIPFVLPGTKNIVYFISNLTDDTVTNLRNNTSFVNSLNDQNPTNSTDNIFKITLTDGKTSPFGSDGFAYFKVNYYRQGETISNGNDTISQSYLQSIVTNVNQFNIGETAESCTCVLEGTLTAVNSQLKNINFNNNCSGLDCRDSEGNKIACVNNVDDITNTSNVTNTIIASTTANVAGFNNLTETQKDEFLKTSTLTLFIILIIANILLTKYPKRYSLILIGFSIIFVFALVIMYVIYSQSFGIENLNLFDF